MRIFGTDISSPHRSLLGAASLWMVVSTAHAQDCDPLDEAELADRVHASLDAIDRADVDGHQAIIKDLSTRIPCMEFVPKPEHWAELLVGIAIVEYATKGEWEKPLATALRVHPRVDLLVGPRHAFRTWIPPHYPESSGVKVPEGVRVYYDGELITEIPQTGGLHLAQRRDGDGWKTLLLDDEPIPASWLKTPELLSAKDPGWGFAEAIVGFGQQSQKPDSPGNFLSEQSATGPTVGVATDGFLRIFGGGGLRFEVAVPAQLPSIAVDGSLGGAWSFGALTASLGGGARTMTLAIDDGSDTYLLPFADLGVAYRQGGLFGAVDLGASPAVLRAYARGGYRPTPRLSVSAEFRWAQGAFEQADVAGESRAIPAQSWSTGLRVGAAWGKR